MTFFPLVSRRVGFARSRGFAATRREANPFLSNDLPEEDCTMPKTIGLSPKLTVPVTAALTAVLTSWVATGAFDGGEVRGLIATIVLAVIAYVAPAGDIDITDATSIELPDAPDAPEALA